MTHLTWQAIREDFTNQFGEYPGPKIEADLIDIFELAPSTVIRTLNDCAEAKAAGDITSPWAIAHSRLTRRRDPIRDVHVDTGKDRAKAIANAEAWIRRTGCQYPSADEAWDELEHGILAGHADTTVETAILALYDETRPSGERVDLDQDERAADWKRTHTCDKCGAIKPFLMAPCPNARKHEIPDPEPEPVLASTTEELPY